MTSTSTIQFARKPAPAAPSDARWSVADVQALFDMPFMDLMFRAQQVHRE
ncbi:MAG: biotin synthase BioB, partial [Betaproteobacteria bacterium HGW-Betaproteobacteria-21]